MPDQDAQIPWSQPGWLEQAQAWVHAEMQRQSMGVSGAIEQPHVRPWSTVLRVPAAAGDLYFKAVAPVLVHEVPITAALARWRPACMLPILAADLERGWMLMPDGGTRLRDQIRADRDVRRWEPALRLYAEAQVELAGRTPELLAMGAPDRRPAALPERYHRLLAGTETLRVGLPDGLTPEEYRRLQELAPRVAALCAELASYGVPDSLHHGDFHDGNIFVRDGRHLFFDWGDCSVAHPFFSLRTTFVSVEISLDLDEGAGESPDLRDAYLEPWTRFEPRSSLQAAFRLAQRLAPLVSALAWDHVVSSLPPPLKEEYAVPVPALLREFLDLEAKA